MKTQLYAVFDKHGFNRATKRAASLGGLEVGLCIDVDIPDRAFDDGYIHAAIAVPENALTLPGATATVAGIDPARDALAGKPPRPTR